jgi:hypothetical protein
LRDGLNAQGRVGKQLQESKGPSRKSSIVTARRKFKGDEVEDEDDDDATLCTEEFFPST